MTVTLHNTSKIVELNGVPARIWEGETSTGIPVHAFITRIAVAKDKPCEEFEKELSETSPPSAEVKVYPLRLVL